MEVLPLRDGGGGAGDGPVLPPQPRPRLLVVGLLEVREEEPRTVHGDLKLLPSCDWSVILRDGAQYNRAQSMLNVLENKLLSI